MTKKFNPQTVSRRDFLRLGGGMLGAMAGAALLRQTLISPERVVEAAASTAANAVDLPPDYVFAATDGWFHLPNTRAIPPYFPDDLAPSFPNDLNAYIFGFRNVTGFTAQQIADQKNKAQHSAPLLALQVGQTTVLELHNLGLAIRPDLVDSHTLHWHGFKNAIPMFDGEPSSSVAVPIGRSLKYVYVPHDPGSYMFHCHFEDVEHVQMGMTGPAIIYPTRHNPGAGQKFAYDDNASQFDREFTVFLSEFWAYAHWCDSHIQAIEWSTYHPDFWMLNGRTYPETLLPAGQGTDPSTGDLIPPAGHPELQYQPVSSLIRVNSGDRVLLRFINLGFQTQSMTLSGIKMKVIAKDATRLLNGPTDLSYQASTVGFGPGESVDALFIAPTVTQETTFLLYNRRFGHLNNGGATGHGGQMTEVHVYPAGTLPEQTAPNA